MKIQMSKGLLSLIIMVQEYRKHLINESIFRADHGIVKEVNWIKETEKYYCNIDSNILSRYGLSKNILSFEKVINFKVTAEMLKTESAELGKFTFQNF